MEMKICNKCSIDKPDDEFAWKNKAAGIKQQICKQCVRAMSKQNYLDNKDRHVRVCRDATRARVERLREYIASLNLKCERCGENHPGVLDFHHTDPTVKESSVSVLIGQGCSFAKVEREIQKCIVLCSNCHRKVHWQERNEMPA